MLMIETPEGACVVLDYIAAIMHRMEGEFATEPNGTLIMLSSGACIETEETRERVLEQIREVLAAYAEATE